LGKRVGGSVNTIVMAMCGGALRRFLIERAELPKPKRPLIAAVPVSPLQADDDSMNNQVSVIRVDLATAIADPVARAAGLHARHAGVDQCVYGRRDGCCRDRGGGRAADKQACGSQPATTAAVGARLASALGQSPLCRDQAQALGRRRRRRAGARASAWVLAAGCAAWVAFHVGLLPVGAAAPAALVVKDRA
jgi:hypothetical protein